MINAYEIAHDGRDRASWLKARLSGIGASEAGAVLGINPFDSPINVYTRKVLGEIDEADSPQMRFGREYERQVIDDFCAIAGREAQPHGQLLRSADRRWQLATLDAVQAKPGLSSPGLLEIKTTGYDWEADGIPEYVTAQIQHQFAVTGFEWGSLAVFSRMSCEILWLDLEPDPKYIDTLNEAEAEFWAGVLDGRPPAPDNTQATADALRKLYPHHEPGKTVDLPAELRDYAAELSEVKDAMSGLSADKRRLENEIKAALGDAEGGVFPDGSGFTFKAQTRKEHVVAESTFRVLRFKEYM